MAEIAMTDNVGQYARDTIDSVVKGRFTDKHTAFGDLLTIGLYVLFPELALAGTSRDLTCDIINLEDTPWYVTGLDALGFGLSAFGVYCKYRPTKPISEPVYEGENGKPAGEAQQKPNGSAVEDLGSSLKKYTVEDFTKEMDELPHPKISEEIKNEITNLPKGEKPLPNDYLSSSDIDTHLSLFDDGAVKIQSKESFESAVQKYGSDIGDPATGTFVLPKNVVNQAIEASNGNPRILEELLGLDQGYLGDAPISLDIHNPPNIRVPSGNESNAWPEYWMPGGYTSGGVPEAVVDQIKSVDYTVSDVYLKK